MKIAVIKNQTGNLQKKIFIASVGLMSLVTPLSASKRQNITNPAPQICNIKENDYTGSNNIKDFFVLEELSKKENPIEKKKKQNDLTGFEKVLTILSSLAIAGLLTSLKNKLLKIANNINKGEKNDASCK